MGGVVAAYITMNAIITARWWTQRKKLPPPMAFVGSAFVYATSALIAQADTGLGNTVAWGYTIGAFLATDNKGNQLFNWPSFAKFTGEPDYVSMGGA